MGTRQRKLEWWESDNIIKLAVTIALSTTLLVTMFVGFKIADYFLLDKRIDDLHADLGNNRRVSWAAIEAIHRFHPKIASRVFNQIHKEMGGE